MDRKYYDITSIGEMFVMLKFNGKNSYKADAYSAAAEVAAYSAVKGLKCAFMGKVGGDGFQETINEYLDKNNISKTAVVTEKKLKNALVLNNGGKTDLYTCGSSACFEFCDKDINTKVLENSKAVHVGSLLLCSDKSKKAIHLAADTAKQNGGIISFDVNLKPTLFRSGTDMKERILSFCSVCDIIKFTRSELYALTGEVDISSAAKALKKYFEPKIIIITDGKSGSTCVYKDEVYKSECKNITDSRDTFGIGNVYFGACLYHLIKNNGAIKPYEMLDFANTQAGFWACERNNKY